MTEEHLSVPIIASEDVEKNVQSARKFKSKDSSGRMRFQG